jgi:hypothetical protein
VPCGQPAQFPLGLALLHTWGNLAAVSGFRHCLVFFGSVFFDLKTQGPAMAPRRHAFAAYELR